MGGLWQRAARVAYLGFDPDVEQPSKPGPIRSVAVHKLEARESF